MLAHGDQLQQSGHLNFQLPVPFQIAILWVFSSRFVCCFFVLGVRLEGVYQAARPVFGLCCRLFSGAPCRVRRHPLPLVAPKSNMSASMDPHVLRSSV